MDSPRSIEVCTKINYQFISIIDQEQQFFLCLMGILFPEITKSDLELSYDVEDIVLPINAVESVLSNPIFIRFYGEINKESLPKLLSPVKEYLSKNNMYKVYCDIYGEDIRYIQNSTTKSPIVLYCGDIYLGHIYCYTTIQNNTLEHIGIRESWFNTLCKLYGKPFQSHISYSLLRACLENSKKYNVEYISLANPIGSMHIISKKFGFVDDRFRVRDTPLI